MKKYLLLLGAFAFMANFSMAQKGSITEKNMEKIRKAYDINDASTRALTNALSNNKVKDLALNNSNIAKIDHTFKYKVKVKGISNQKSSGRCWMFTSMNTLRPLVIDKYSLSKFEFSQNYLYFWDIFEKSNLFLEAVIKYADQPMDSEYNRWAFRSPVSDGGVWNSFTNLADKYGLVPKAVFPETNSSENTHYMVSAIKTKLREHGLELREMMAKKEKSSAIQDRKIEMMGDVYRMLSLNLGEPPVKFNYRFVDKDENIGETKEYTPKSFMKEVLGDINFEDYIMIMNDPTRPFNKLYEIEYDRNVLEGRNWKYLNLDNELLKKYAMASIKANKAMYASCDVGAQMNNSLGFSDPANYDYAAIYGVDFGMDKKERVLTFESGSSHGMALIAVDVDENEKPTKWQFENSWGSSANHNGYLTFTDKWFEEYMFRVVVHKSFIDAEVLKYLDQKATMLPPWDPMFSEDK
jgi:bleomycin hydrolase